MTSGPSQTDHFEADGIPYLVVAENFNRSVSIYRMYGTALISLEKVQALTVPGSGAVALGYRSAAGPGHRSLVPRQPQSSQHCGSGSRGRAPHPRPPKPRVPRGSKTKHCTREWA